MFFDTDDMLPLEKVHHDTLLFMSKLISTIDISAAPTKLDLQDKDSVFLYGAMLNAHCELDQQQYEWSH